MLIVDVAKGSMYECYRKLRMCCLTSEGTDTCVNPWPWVCFYSLYKLKVAFSNHWSSVWLGKAVVSPRRGCGGVTDSPVLCWVWFPSWVLCHGVWESEIRKASTVTKMTLADWASSPDRRKGHPPTERTVYCPVGWDATLQKKKCIHGEFMEKKTQDILEQNC